MKDAKILAIKLEEIRTHADSLGFSVGALLLAAGIHPTYWSRWVKGEHCPSEPTMARIKSVKHGPGRPREGVA